MLSDTFGVPDGGAGGTTGVPETGVSVEMILRARLCLRARSACIASYWNVSLSISDSGLFAELEITTRSAANM